MTLRLAENLLAFLMFVCFSALGCCLVRRRPVSVREINECFLAGLSICSILLFPFTLLAPRHALLACELFLGAATFVAFRTCLNAPVEKEFGHRFRDEVFVSPRHGILGCAGMAILVLVVTQFFVQNLRLSYLWDGYQIW